MQVNGRAPSLLRVTRPDVSQPKVPPDQGPLARAPQHRRWHGHRAQQKAVEMTRTVRCILPLRGDIERARAKFTGDPSVWLPDARACGHNMWRMMVGPGQLEYPVDVVIGPPWQAGRTSWRPFSWVPAADPDHANMDKFLPALDAEVALDVGANGDLTLVVDGQYKAPGGRVGEMLDAVATGRVAHRTLERLFASIGANLTASTPAA